MKVKLNNAAPKHNILFLLLRYNRTKDKTKRCKHMPNVFDTARYILEKQGQMSTMKLQKLCYYAQAWSLVWDDKPLFDEEFRAWVNGPVCEELFEKKQKANFLLSLKMKLEEPVV